MSDHRLHELASVPIKLVWHENKATYLSVRKEKKLLHLRVHRLFYDAPTPVLEALIKYALKKDRESGIVIKQMAHMYFSSVVREAGLLEPKGNVYDLSDIFERMNPLLPEKVEGVSIGWSNRKSRKSKFRSITLGTFDKHCHQIRINQILDEEDVPLYFIEFIVYHEMLHAICPSIIDKQGRCSVHTKEFRAFEKQFPEYEKARAWEKNSLNFFKRKKGSYGRS